MHEPFCVPSLCSVANPNFFIRFNKYKCNIDFTRSAHPSRTCRQLTWSLPSSSIVPAECFTKPKPLGTYMTAKIWLKYTLQHDSLRNNTPLCIDISYPLLYPSTHLMKYVGSKLLDTCRGLCFGRCECGRARTLPWHTMRSLIGYDQQGRSLP